MSLKINNILSTHVDEYNLVDIILDYKTIFEDIDKRNAYFIKKDNTIELNEHVKYGGKQYKFIYEKGINMIKLKIYRVFFDEEYAKYFDTGYSYDLYYILYIYKNDVYVSGPQEYKPYRVIDFGTSKVKSIVEKTNLIQETRTTMEDIFDNIESSIIVDNKKLKTIIRLTKKLDFCLI